MNHESQMKTGLQWLSTLFTYPFRIFFLSLAIWAIVAIFLWVPVISGYWQLPLALPAMLWHQHEMLFGFVSAAIAGFLLTAVCVWTQTDRLHGVLLVGLWSIWLLGRLVMTLGEGLPDWLVIVVNLLFLPLVMLDAGRRIWMARQRRQLIVLVAVALIWLMQVGFLLLGSSPFVEGALVAIMLLMLVIGGRITPAFSKGWLRMHGENPDLVRQVSVLEALTIVSMLLLLVTVVFDFPDSLVLGIALLSALVSGVRLFLWRGWRVRAEPLLWILHLSLLWIPAALLLFAGAILDWWSSTLWVHAAGAGAMGGLILGVISRVCLGHTGRALVLPAGMVLAFIMLHTGALIRIITALGIIPWQVGITVSGLCWILAFAVFIWRYTSILTSPRPDGRPG